MFNKLRAIWAIAFFSLTFNLAAQEKTNPEQEIMTKSIELEADSGSYDVKKGIATYQGNVKIKQEKMELQGDKVEVYFNDNKVEKIKALGKPAKFKYQPKNNPTIYGSGNEMTYSVTDKNVKIQGDALIKQGENELKASALDYDLKREYLKSQRVKIIFQNN